MTDARRSAPRNEATVAICGAAGQGIQTIENLLPRLFRLSGRHTCAVKEYMSRVRGGSNSTLVRVSNRRTAAHLGRIDLLIPLDAAALPHMQGRISSETVVIGDKERVRTDGEIVDVPFGEMAEKAGGRIYENVAAAGTVAGLFGLDALECERYVGAHFAGKGEEVAAGNRRAFRAGHARGEALRSAGVFAPAIESSRSAGADILLSGAEAVGLGALAGGCRFIAAYPMTPSTGIFTFLAQNAADFGIIAEQAEDEIAAMNMSLGAWYAGARAMVTTSGGGFALMVEGLSLAGMIESPAVIVFGQRPGPATGLPTRTEQGDLLFALFAGHGEFPRAVLTPGTLEEAFELTRHAFDLADRCQAPVFVMVDQYLMDTQRSVAPFDLANLQVTHRFVETQAGYRRYAITENGVSPRGIPGHGRGLVGVDSDEHDEEGHITEDLALRTRMVDKRLRKGKLLAEAALAPRLCGREDFDTLLIGWGSTVPVLEEALEHVGGDGIAALCLSQVHPLHPEVGRLLGRAKRTVAVEGNATAQLASLLSLALGHRVDAAILKYDGLPFSVADLAERIREEVTR